MIALNETIYTQHGCAATYILHVHLCMLCMEKLIETMEKSVETMEKSSETMEKPSKSWKTHRKTTEKSIKPWRNR